MRIATANQKQQVTKIQSMKKFNLKIRQAKIRHEKLLLKQIVNQNFEEKPPIFLTA